MMTKAHLLGVATSSKGLVQEESNPLMVRTSDGFNLNIYKLMEKSGYDFSKQPSLGYIIEAKPYRPKDTQKNDTKTGWQTYDTKD